MQAWHCTGYCSPLQPPCLRHNSSIKGRIALENRWDLMIAPRPWLIDWMISSLSRLAALPAAQPPSHSSSSPLPVTYPPLPLPLQLSTPLTLPPSMHQCLCLNHSPSFTFPLSGSHHALLCASNSDCHQISRILISTSDHVAIITERVPPRLIWCVYKMVSMCFHTVETVVV